ncbi:response regulator [Couchioplanes azureus]|uniref:response regulator n=1 Tax=Couchioplanes caeruleus TaxID=56438 RepID=UPI0016706931|nr:response regulator transcription factor [Couchioplanes caeruleus]GGQ82271.1 DNA-binding response regulator [Couchioplanes caeruleus subsp. azureus]
MSECERQIRVLLVDDHPVWREGLAVLLASVPSVEVVGTAADGAAAVAAAAREQPDVVLMDIQMPVMNGAEATREVTAQSPHIAVVALTMLEDDETLFNALRAGAIGYLLKGATQADILRAITSAANGEAHFGPAIARRITRYFAAQPTSASSLAFPQLTQRENEVLKLIADGLTNAQITARLTLAHQTVRNHVHNIFAKLHVADRAEAMTRAREAGLGHRRGLNGPI